MATNVDLPAFVRGDTWTNKFTFTDEAGTPIDITGYTLWVTLKLDPTVTDSLADLQSMTVVPSGVDATGGVGYVISPAADTDGLTPTTYSYDMQYKTPSGDVQTMAYGFVEVVEDITRDTT